MYTSNYEIFDIFDKVVKPFKANILLQISYTINQELLKSIRYCTVQKPLEFDKEKKNDEFVKALSHAGFTAIKDDKKDYWSKIKEQTSKSFTGENCFWFYHPVTFLDALDSMGILNIHAKELFEIQQLVVHLNNLRPHSTNNKKGGLRGEQSGTFCNHAIFATIRALDKNYTNFTGGKKGIPDSMDDRMDDTYKKQYEEDKKIWISNVWCDVLEYQADPKRSKETGIKMISEEEANRQANLGRVVVAAWKNTEYPASDGICHPHYATVAPSSFTKREGTIVANVGSRCGFLKVSTAFHKHDNEVKYYYNTKQDFSCDKDAKTKLYPSLNKMKEDYDTWSNENDLWDQYM